MFFDALRDKADRIKSIKVDKLLSEIWRDPITQKFIINLNTEEQLFFGLKANGEILPRYASSEYLNEKRAAGVALNPFINLKLSGAFYKSFDVIPNSVGFLIDANTNIYPDSGDFVDVYGLDILGLNENNTEKLTRYLQEEIQKWIKVILDV
jgi:hypothetical protein